MRPLICAILMLPAPSFADDVSDTIRSALDAYEQGDRAYAMDELNFAIQLLQEMKTGDFTALFPAAPDGWSREISTEMAAAMGMMGGGTGAEATYSGDGGRVEITFIADSPMIGAFAGMLANPAIAQASGGKLVRVGREKFILQKGEFTGLVGGRILIRASGSDPDRVLALLETIDFRALQSFGT